ncbi:Hypothetical predicted protein [Pelobates cultripes]|uniref:Uncharacterized protein n=1 Tax=Pelobates cultripes TaxID=61616 RepID=A0AAD1QZ63_PELCU|nr:Hypothetical predicted protein [Pelobates cultripes]
MTDTMRFPRHQTELQDKLAALFDAFWLKLESRAQQQASLHATSQLPDRHPSHTKYQARVRAARKAPRGRRNRPHTSAKHKKLYKKKPTRPNAEFCRNHTAYLDTPTQGIKQPDTNTPVLRGLKPLTELQFDKVPTAGIG